MSCTQIVIFLEGKIVKVCYAGIGVTCCELCVINTGSPRDDYNSSCEYFPICGHEYYFKLASRQAASEHLRQICAACLPGFDLSAYLSANTKSISKAKNKVRKLSNKTGRILRLK